MAVDTDQLALLQQAVMAGQPLSSTGLPNNAEIRRAYEDLVDEYALAPEGTMVEIVSDIDFGKYDSLIAATEKATGIKYF